jgi:hypothetical protein
MKKAVGFDQKILLKHLDYTLQETNNSTMNEMYGKLNEFLLPDIQGEKSRKNAITMLMKIWYRVGDGIKPLQQEALSHFNDINSEQRFIYHWMMSLLAYPFLRDIATEIGRLSKIQDEFSGSQLMRKIKDIYGDRRRVEVAVNAVITTLKKWNAIENARNKLLYRTKPKRTIEDIRLKQWLVHAVLVSTDIKYMELELISKEPYLFPFDIKLHPGVPDKLKFNIQVLGVNKLMVGLK